MSGRPDKLQPGDIILFRNHGWLGAVISWGEWSGQPGESLEYSHIALVLDDEHACEMNPPASRKYPLSEVPWDRVDVFRLKFGVAYPLDLIAVRQSFQAEVARRLGEHYHFGYIATAAGVGVLSRIGLGKFARWLMTRSNPLPSLQLDVCSTWAEEVLRVAVRTLEPSFDLFPWLGDDRARPSDWPSSPWVVRVGP